MNKKVAAFICIILSILPILYMIKIVASTGTNVTSNDLIHYVDEIDSFLEGTYNWKKLFQDSFLVSHIMVFPLLVRFVIAYLSNWNVYWEYYFGIVLCIGQLLFLYFALTKFNSQRFNLWLLPILSGLIFSTVHLNTFTFGETSLALGFLGFGFSLGIWSLTQFPNQFIGVLIAAIGGIIASWSWGAGLITFPAFGLGLILLRFRKIWHYLFAILSFIIALIPYFMYVFSQSSNSKASHFLNRYLFEQAISYPFTFGDTVINIDDWPIAAISLILLFIILCVFFYKKNLKFFYKISPSLMLIFFGLLTMWQITSFRDYHAPWYSTPFMNFWIGYLGIAFVLYQNKNSNQLNHYFQSFFKYISLFLLFSITFLYIISGTTYVDKGFFLKSRTPAATACLREYLTSPTYCVDQLFLWDKGDIAEVQTMAEPLKKHHLSVFASPQVWTLQGDYILDTVKTQDTRDRQIFWSSDRGQDNITWSDFRHLNVIIPDQTQITWKMTLPEHLTTATLKTAIAPATQSPKNTPISFKIDLQTPNQPPTPILSQTLKHHHWTPVNLPLSQYAGQTITLSLSTSSPQNQPITGVYRYPQIKITLDPEKTSFTPTSPTPSNTDLHPNFTPLSQTEKTLSLPIPENWELFGLQPQPNPQFLITEFPPHLKYQKPLNICPNDYTHLTFKMSISPTIFPQSVTLFYYLNGETELTDKKFHNQRIPIPLISDGKLHEYHYKLNLINLDSNTCITGLDWYPVWWHFFSTKSTTPSENWVKLEQFTLIKKNS